MHAPVQISIHGHATYHHIANLEMHTHTHRDREHDWHVRMCFSMLNGICQQSVWVVYVHMH